MQHTAPLCYHLPKSNDYNIFTILTRSTLISSKGLCRQSQSLTENSSKSISESVSKKTQQIKSSKGGEMLEIVVDDIVEPLKKKPNSKELPLFAVPW